MDINMFRGILTIVLLVLFIGLCFTVFSKKRKKQYEDAAKMALDNEGTEKNKEVNHNE